METMAIWNKLHKPPASALKTIGGGRLKGFTDINPQWRYEAMTEVFGPCGIGWKFTIDKTWREDAADGQVFAFAHISVYIKHDGVWSDPIPGQGGSMLVEKEKTWLHSSDEGYKMAITDALGTAMKMLGVASEVYSGRWDGSKYQEKPEKFDVDPYLKTIFASKTLDELKTAFNSAQLACKHDKDALKQIIAAKDTRKLDLEDVPQ